MNHMKQQKKDRDQLYRTMESRLKFPTSANKTTLYHHIHSMILSGEYIFKSEADLSGLMNFLNGVEAEYEMAD